jgi:hypothetical protein
MRAWDCAQESQRVMGGFVSLGVHMCMHAWSHVLEPQRVMGADVVKGQPESPSLHSLLLH